MVYPGHCLPSGSEVQGLTQRLMYRWVLKKRSFKNYSSKKWVCVGDTGERVAEIGQGEGRDKARMCLRQSPTEGGLSVTPHLSLPEGPVVGCKLLGLPSSLHVSRQGDSSISFKKSHGC